VALAETARLLATYEVQDKSAAGIRSATTGLTGLQTRARTFGTTLKTHVGGALTHFGGQLRSIASVGLASLGVAGLFGVVGLFKSAISEARTFGDLVFRLQAITGLSAETTSRLADALGDFGVESSTALRVAGLFEKNIQRLGGTQEKAAKFEKDYGLKIRDSSGNLLDFNKQLLESAGFFNDKTIPASQKAAALAALYGRNWQALVPILKEGRQGLQDTLDTSLTLSEADIKAIEENRIATRKWNDAIGDLQVKIGVGLLPTITELVTSLTGWVTTHGPEIQTFFRNGVNTAKAIGGAVVGIVGGIAKIWDGIPEPLKDLLIKGFVAEKTANFLFGFSPAKLAVGLVGGALGGIGKGIFGSLFARGSSPANPMWVATVGGGLGGVPGGGAGAGGLGLLGGVLGLAAVGVAEVLIAGEVGKWLRTQVTGSDAPLTSDHVVATLGPVEIGLFRSQQQAIRDLTMRKFDPTPRADRELEGSGQRRTEAAAGQAARDRQMDSPALRAAVKDVATATKATGTKIEATKRSLQQAQSRAASQINTKAGSVADRIVRALYATRPKISMVVNVRGQVIGTHTSSGNFVDRTDTNPNRVGGA
jgi:hypothetical protein